MKDRVALLIYLAAILAGTSVHDLRFLALALAAVLLLAGRHRLRILRKACLAVVFFNLVVSVSYAVLAGLAGNFSAHYLVLVNLRVLFLTCLTFLFAARANPFRALAFSESLTYLFTLAYSQAMVLAQVLANFRLAFRSRSIERVKLGERYRHSATVGGLLLDKALHNATEIGHVMRSRGFFDD